MNYQDYARECLRTLSKQTPSAQNVRDFALLTLFLEPNAQVVHKLPQNGSQNTVQNSSKENSLEIDGDTEFEKILMAIPKTKYKQMIRIFNGLVQDIQVINNRAYINFIERLKNLI